MRAVSTWSGQAASRRRGFTLLEMVLVMFIASMLVAAVFGIVGSVTSLADSMTVEQHREGRIRGFVELCARTFRCLPPSAVVRLRNHQSGAGLASELAFGRATSPLSGESGSVFVLGCEEAADGYFQVFLRHMNAAQAVDWQAGDMSVGVRIPLLEGVARLEWRFFDERSGQWAHLWNEKSHIVLPRIGDGHGVGGITTDKNALRPTLVELCLSFGSERAQRYLFWVPPHLP